MLFRFIRFLFVTFLAFILCNILMQVVFSQIRRHDAHIDSPIDFLSLFKSATVTMPVCFYYNGEHDMACKVKDITFRLHPDGRAEFLISGMRFYYDGHGRLEKVVQSISGKYNDELFAASQRSVEGEGVLDMIHSLSSFLEEQISDPSDFVHAELYTSPAEPHKLHERRLDSEHFDAEKALFGTGRHARVESDAGLVIDWWAAPEEKEHSVQKPSEANSFQFEASKLHLRQMFQGVSELFANATEKEHTFYFKNIPLRDASIVVESHDSFLKELKRRYASGNPKEYLHFEESWQDASEEQSGNKQAPEDPLPFTHSSTPIVGVWNPDKEKMMEFELVSFKDSMKWFPLPGYYANVTLRQLTPERSLLYSWDGYTLQSLTKNPFPISDENPNASLERALTFALIQYRRWNLFWNQFCVQASMLSRKVSTLRQDVERIRYTEGHFVHELPKQQKENIEVEEEASL